MVSLREGGFGQPQAQHRGVDETSEYLSRYAPFFEHSHQMRALRRRIELVADTDASVLIRGESGVGKDLVANALHLASRRRASPFVKVNCAALPAELLESELFGHEKGAFTGAYRRKLGKFEVASGGTIFLDEIGDMPTGLQAKLLHAVENHEFARVGGSEVIRVNVRIVASTNRNLEAAVRAGQFRDDLYYRLKVISLHVPPLRERRTEIPILATMFVQRFSAQYQRNLSLSLESLRLLTEYSWPGNVRELENLLTRVVVLQDEQLICEELGSRAESHPPTLEPDILRNQTLKIIVRNATLHAERAAIKAVLERVNWNRAEAARALKIGYKSLLYKMDQCGLSRKLAARRQGGPTTEGQDNERDCSGG
jgi:two-component system response regulator AtoC